MPQVGIMLAPTLLLIYIGFCYGSSLQFIINQRKTECFYFEKTAGEKLEAWFEVANGQAEISYAVFDPKEVIIQKESRVVGSSVYLEINVTGDYAICFSGRQLTSPINVYFDFDPELDDQTMHAVEKKFSTEKRNFLNRVLRNIKFNEELKKKKYNLTEQFMMDIVKSHKVGITDGDPDANVENSIMYLSILADSMMNSMEKHKVQMRSHFNMQRNNLYDVDLFSSLILVSMLIGSCIQIIVLKSFFTGKMSLKIWQF